MIWLGEERGALADWTTQAWVRATGRRIDLAEQPWLDGPVGSTRGIGPEFFERLAEREGWDVRRGGPARGLLPDFSLLEGPGFDPAAVDPGVVRFYERTSDYSLDAWGEWSGPFRPFGRLLAVLFSRRLRQLNVPLSALDTSRGMTSEVLQLVEPGTGRVRLTAWVRQLVGTGRVVYAGSYSCCSVPGHAGPCVKVVFPLPNGNAIVVMKPEAGRDGAFTITSAGERFGDPGFYFTVHGDGGRVWARQLRTMRESIRVYPDAGCTRADHLFTLWGAVFLRLHYRMSEGGGAGPPLSA